jgi:hypothetical protein
MGKGKALSLSGFPLIPLNFPFVLPPAFPDTVEVVDPDASSRLHPRQLMAGSTPDIYDR